MGGRQLDEARAERLSPLWSTPPLPSSAAAAAAAAAAAPAGITGTCPIPESRVPRVLEVRRTPGLRSAHAGLEAVCRLGLVAAKRCMGPGGTEYDR